MVALADLKQGPDLPDSFSRAMKAKFAKAWEHTLAKGFSEQTLLSLYDRCMSKATAIGICVPVSQRARTWIRWFYAEVKRLQRYEGARS